MPYLFKLFLAVCLVGALACAPNGLAAQGVQDFQLEPDEQETAEPRVQGPIDTESGSVPVEPRVISQPRAQQTPAPRPPAVQPVPAPRPPATTVQRQTQGAGSGTTSSAPPPITRPARPAATPAPQPAPLPTGPARLPLDPGETVPIVPVPVDEPEPVVRPADENEPAPVPESDGASRDDWSWTWPAIGLALLAALALAAFAKRRKHAVKPATIERPVVAAGGRIAPSELKVQVEAVKLTRSVMNATLQYRVHLLNRATTAITNVSVGADIVSAHGGVPVEQQVASEAQALEKRHTFDRIAPGQSVRYDGQLTIPLAQVRAIRQAAATLFVPLLRIRIDGASDVPLLLTFVVGTGVPGAGRVTPFRLDEGPRSWQPIAARALD